MGMILFFARQYDEAIEQLMTVLDLDQNFWQAHVWLFYVYLKTERYEDALVTLQRIHDPAGSTPIYQYFYAWVHALSGNRDEAVRVLSAPGWSEQTPWRRAVVYGALGRIDEAFLELDQAYEERNSLLSVAKADPRLDLLRGDPRFQELLVRMNYPEN